MFVVLYFYNHFFLVYFCSLSRLNLIIKLKCLQRARDLSLFFSGGWNLGSSVESVECKQIRPFLYDGTATNWRAKGL